MKSAIKELARLVRDAIDDWGRTARLCAVLVVIGCLWMVVVG